MSEESMTQLETLQVAVGKWARKNFGVDRQAWEQVVGVMEEGGELAHAFLKLHQGIRYSRKIAEDKIKDAVGDIVIYLIDFCCTMGYDFDQIVEETWSKVKTRDWVKDPKLGVTATEHSQKNPVV